MTKTEQKILKALEAKPYASFCGWNEYKIARKMAEEGKIKFQGWPTRYRGASGMAKCVTMWEVLVSRIDAE